MSSRSGRITLVVIGVIAIVIGAVFGGQGLGLIPGSAMTGESMWFYIGAVIVIVGIVLVVLGLRRPASSRTRR